MDLLTLPVLLPLSGGALLLLLKGPRARTRVAVVAALLTLLASSWIAFRSFSGAVLSTQLGGWPAPYGITLVADGLTGIMLLLSGVTGLLTVLYAGSSLQRAPRRGGTPILNRAREILGLQALLQFLLMGVNMSFVTGDLFNLFVSFEVMLIASFGLLLIGGTLPQLREGFKYVVVNLVASAIFVAAAGLAYGLFGTLNLADIASRSQGVSGDPRVTLVALLLALVFAIKAAVFPFGFWLPQSYPVVPGAVGAFFGAVLTKVGVYALLRLFTLVTPNETGLQEALLLLAGLTILFAVLGAVVQRRWRQLLAFANIASVGYLVLGLAGGALAPTLYYLIHSVLVIFTLFLLAGLAELVAGEHFGGDGHNEGHLGAYPLLGAIYFVAALALAGLPPTSGFIGKFALVQALLETGGVLRTAVAAVAVAAGLLLLYAAMGIWRGFFWGDEDAVHRLPLPKGMRRVTGVAGGLLVLLALFSGPVYALSERVAAQLETPTAYITGVLPQEEAP
jgi:multicomponent Na+:H+ antiporter subunit D